MKVLGCRLLPWGDIVRYVQYRHSVGSRAIRPEIAMFH